MREPSRTIVAEIHRHPAGRELVVTFEGVPDDVLETKFEHLDFLVLIRRAEDLRTTLETRGWLELRPAELNTVSEGDEARGVAAPTAAASPTSSMANASSR
jgi:hypothetical protein